MLFRRKTQTQGETTMPDTLTIEQLKKAVSGTAAAFRCRTVLIPAKTTGKLL